MKKITLLLTIVLASGVVKAQPPGKPLKSDSTWRARILNSSSVPTISSFIIQDSLGTAASRDTLGNWNIIDARRALEAIYRIYVPQNWRVKP